QACKVANFIKPKIKNRIPGQTGQCGKKTQTTKRPHSSQHLSCKQKKASRPKTQHPPVFSIKTNQYQPVDPTPLFLNRQEKAHN
ncbi:MAG: hypothetical protein KAU94_02040, partial [Verrucomicrobia bacterium]|nr:hypothetical protein [Verrucomicrobiota bacterium]